MSEEQTKPSGKENGEEAITTPQPIELIVNKKTGDIVFKSVDGQMVMAKATVIEADEGETVTEIQPLTPEQFREALQRLHDIGLTWTVSGIKPTGKDDSALMSAEFEQFQKEYPTLPREGVSIAFHYLVGTECPEEIAGNEETFRKKVDIAKDFYLNDEYRAEFFFIHAIKVPYFSEIDWEVVVKTYEKNVSKFAGVAYALLSLHLDSPNRKVQNQIITVAVNTAIVKKLLATLEEVKKALEGTQKLTGVLHSVKEKVEAEKVEDGHSKDSTERVG